MPKATSWPALGLCILTEHILDSLLMFAVGCGARLLMVESSQADLKRKLSNISKINFNE